MEYFHDITESQFKFILDALSTFTFNEVYIKRPSWKTTTCDVRKGTRTTRTSLQFLVQQHFILTTRFAGRKGK